MWKKNIKISILLDIYGKLLTQKQRELLNDYYNNDLSLSEIAENENITRQAVRDNLKKGENKLFEYEEKLEYMKKTEIQKEKINSIISDIEKLKKSNLEIIYKELENIKNNLNTLL